MRRLFEPLTNVTTDANRPTGFQWRNRKFQILSIDDQWRICKWYPIEQKRMYYRVTARDVQRRTESTWVIYELGGKWVAQGMQD